MLSRHGSCRSSVHCTDTDAVTIACLLTLRARSLLRRQRRECHRMLVVFVLVVNALAC